MKQIRSVLCGIFVLGTIQLHALPYLSDSNKGFVSEQMNPVVKDTSLYVYTSVILHQNQLVYEAGDLQDRNPDPTKKRNRVKEKQRVNIPQVAGTVMFGILELAVEVAAQLWYYSL